MHELLVAKPEMQADAAESSLDQPWIVQKPDDFVPHKLIQIILSDWPIRTQRPVQPPISIRTDAAIVIQFVLRRVFWGR